MNENNKTNNNICGAKPIEISKQNIIQQNSNNKQKKGSQLKRKSTLKKRLFEKPDFVEQLLNKDIINTFDFMKTDPEIHKLLIILTQQYGRRIQKENEFIFSFLSKIKMQEVLKSDLLESDLTWEELFSFIKPYIFGKICNYFDTLYYSGNESDLLYIIIHGKIGRYTLVEFTKSVTCEEYYLFLCNCLLKYQKMLKGEIVENKNKEKNEKDKNNKDEGKEEDDEENEKLELKDDEYIDEYLLNQIIDKNKEIYPLHSYDDINKLNIIIFKIKLLSVLSEGKSSDAIDLFEKYRFPATFLGYDKVIERKMTPQIFLQKLSKNVGPKGRYYMKQLGLIPQKVKILKFVKKDFLTPFNFFGNFEIIDCAPKRKYTTRCESDKCILLYIDKRMYLLFYIIHKKIKEKKK